jgi:hypothetical protein
MCRITLFDDINDDIFDGEILIDDEEIPLAKLDFHMENKRIIKEEEIKPNLTPPT